jgi:pimeloyl-ACP methyl ester carboxylesterase
LERSFDERSRTYVRLYTETYGNGLPCVFIHGAGGSSLSWVFQRELERSMQVILTDLPGHGKSPGEAPDAIEGFTGHVYDTLQSLNLERCFIAGHSMGGAVAMSLAMAHPDLVKGLILIGTGARLRTMPEILEGVLQDKEKTVRMIVDFSFDKHAFPTIKESGFAQMMRCSAQTLYNDFQACTHFDVMDDLHTIRVPTLITCGRWDLLTPPKYSEYLHRHIEGSYLDLIDGAGHLVMLERPRELNRTIERFIKAHGRHSQ